MAFPRRETLGHADRGHHSGTRRGSVSVTGIDSGGVVRARREVEVIGMRQELRAAVIVLLAMFAAVNISASLDRGEIRGTVTDAQGAVVPGVEVVVTNTATNVATRLT